MILNRSNYYEYIPTESFCQANWPYFFFFLRIPVQPLFYPPYGFFEARAGTRHGVFAKQKLQLKIWKQRYP
jgi:hypothetical protein